MSRDTIGDVLSATTWRSHSCYENDIFYLLERLLFRLTIIPSFMVHPLSENLNGRLGSINLFLGHVQIINEDNEFLARGWSEHSLSPLFKLGIEHVLCLVRAGLS